MDQDRPPATPRQRAFFYAGVFLVCASILMLQVAQTRILSVTTWYHLAFFVISMAMFGMTAGAVVVYLQRERYSRDALSHHLERASLVCAVTIPLTLMLQFTIVTAFALSFTVVVVFAALAVVLAVPFYFGGIVVSLALTRSPFPVGLVYGADLLGAGAGCLVALLLLNLVDGPSAVLTVSVVMALAGVCFSRSGIGGRPAVEGRGAWLLRRRKSVLTALALILAANLATDHGIQPIWVKGDIERYSSELEFVKWNSYSRVAAYESRLEPPQLWGGSPKLPPELEVEEMRLNIDGVAGTAMYRFGDHVRETGFLEYDVTNLAYALPGRKGTAGVIGVGGGRDVLSAWYFGMEEVVGVEVNPIFVQLHREDSPFGDYSGLADLPNVQLVVDEARSWFARTERTFDVIQMSLIDTWAATGSGAFSLSENGLYTREAWRIFLEHLTDEGVFTVSRWFAPDHLDETGRMISLAVASLFDLGVSRPRDHVFVATCDRIATLVLSRRPLSQGDVAALEATAERLEFDVLIRPGATVASPRLERIVSARDLEELEAYTASLPLDLTPPGDDRPFFFNQLRLDRPLELLQVARGLNPGVLFGNIIATATLLVILLVSVVLVVTTIVIPMRFSVRAVEGRLVAGGTAYFLLIGLGFMMAEIGLLQRISVFLGHPAYSLSVVLFSIIVATGVGSLLSERIPLDTAGRLALWAVVTAAYIGVLPLWMPEVFRTAEAAGLQTRAALAVAVIAPAGILMGFGFPTGIRLVSAWDDRPTPWFWAVNGAAGVLASGTAILVAMTFGIGVTLLISGACYVALIPAARHIGFEPTRELTRWRKPSVSAPPSPRHDRLDRPRGRRRPRVHVAEPGPEPPRVPARHCGPLRQVRPVDGELQPAAEAGHGLRPVRVVRGRSEGR